MAAKITWIFFSTIMLALFGWQVANEHLYKNATENVNINWLSPGFGRALAVNVHFRSVTFGLWQPRNTL
jgi:hypothetical protein